MAKTAKPHFHDIDGARSVLMFLSVALHAGTVYAPARPWITGNAERHDFFDWLIFGFHLFITPTFFFVGGFFAVMLLSRRTFGDFLWNRFLRTVIPLVSIAVTLNMVEHYLRWSDNSGLNGFSAWVASGDFARVWVSGEWALHLWFLVSLVPMFILAGVVHKVLPDQSAPRRAAVWLSDAIARLLKKSWAFALFLLLLAGANTANFAVASLMPGAYDLILPGFQSWYKLVSEFPFFVLGVMTALSPSLLKRLVQWRSWMPYAAALAILFQPYAQPDQGQIEAMAMLFANQLAIWVLVLFILQFFHRYFADPSPRTAWLADCALSMYLFHHCLVYIYGRMLVPVDWPIALEFTILTMAAAGTVIAVHELLVRRHAIVRLLFNGKTDIKTVRKQPGLWASFARRSPA